jgi:hypothetical protein
MTEKGLFMHRFAPFLTLFFLVFCLCSCEIAADYVFLISEGTCETVSDSMRESDTPFVTEEADSVDTTPPASSPPLPPDTDDEATVPDTETYKTAPAETTETEIVETPPIETTASVIVPSTTKPSTTEPVITETPKPVTTAPSDTAPPTEEGGIVLLSITETVARGKTATLSIRGTPYATYQIKVYYSTTESKAKGLEPKAADADGTVTWSWKVGTRTKSGSHRIVIRGDNGETLNLSFTTTE